MPHPENIEDMQGNKLRLLQFLRLDKEYVDGRRDWLVYEENGRRTEVLDLSGSYGINMLGHKNPELQRALLAAISSGPPAFVQASRNSDLVALSERIATPLAAESGHGYWFVEYANTGAEIVEAALKLASLDFASRRAEVLQEIYASLKQPGSAGQFERDALEQGLRAVEAAAFVLHLEGSFHGKTLGALSAMGNARYKEKFETAFQAIALEKEPEALARQVAGLEVEYHVWDKRRSQLRKKRFMPVVGFLLEPIQGEAGVRMLSEGLVEVIFALKKRYDFPLISDEIQSGLYRSGKFCALHHFGKRADIYCFGKALGGGMTKISALAARRDRFDTNFFRFHSTTFGEDAYSAKVALKSLELLERYRSQDENWLNRLSAIREAFPDYVEEVRGMGHFGAIELKEESIKNSYLRKYLKDIDLLGYWISSVLLNREDVRVLPTLSAPLSFRLQPSLMFGESEFRFLMKALGNFFHALRSGDTEYLFGHILPIGPGDEEKMLPDAVRREEFPENAAVFLCHPVEFLHYAKIVDLLDGFEEEALLELIDSMSEFQKFTPYHICQIANGAGQVVDVVFLGIPFTSKVFYDGLRSGKRRELIRVVQDAVDLANARNARVIGLGQFTSIITENGLRLHSPKARLTTGNAYTAQSVIDALLLASEMHGKSLSNGNLGVIGAAGNIISVITEALLDRVGHLSLYYRKDLMNSGKNQESIRNILGKVRDSGHWPELGEALAGYDLERELPAVLLDSRIGEYVSVHTNLEDLPDCDFVLCGANASEPFVGREHLAQGAIVIDLAVPPNVREEVRHSSDFVYLKGGMIELPAYQGRAQRLDSVIFPFEEGECYACMAETIGLAFAEEVRNSFIGDLDLEKLREIAGIMRKNGFSVKGLKMLVSR